MLASACKAQAGIIFTAEPEICIRKGQGSGGEGQTFEYVIPPSIAEDKETKDVFEKFMSEAQKAYDLLIKKLNEKGITGEAANQDARFVLPNAAETKIVVTMNARSSCIFNVRCCERAQWEIRRSGLSDA